MAAPKLKVLISGAGIAGPCLAYWLARTRLHTSIVIVERAATPRVTGQAIDIRGTAIEIMRRMGLEEEVRGRHTTEEGTAFVNRAGEVFAEFGGGGGDTFTAEYEILRADLSQLFLEVTEKLHNVRYVYGDSIQSLDQTDQHVRVTFAKGTQDTFDLVVAADGSTSTTRPLILDASIRKDTYKPLGQYVAYFSIPRIPTDTKIWDWFNTLKGLVVMIRPHRNPATMGAYLCVTMPTREQPDPALDEVLQKGDTAATKRLLRSYFAGAGWQTERVLAGMDEAQDFYMSRTALVKLPKWTNGRALVLGDAAFATFGIGTSLAIESAYTLAGELSKAAAAAAAATINGASRIDVPQALENYERVFRSSFFAKAERGIPSGFLQLACPQTAWGLRVRNFVLWLISKTKVYTLFQGRLGPSTELDRQVSAYDWVDI